MNKEQLKEYYYRFKKWQEQPFEYTFNPDKVHHCNNCEHDYTGNFCPVCSQKAELGRISWHSVRQGVMDIWGLGTRSLLYTIWQLLWRPGHIISDYINGKRQVSFPPVKMLFIIAVIYSMLVYWFFPDVLGINIVDTSFDPEKERAMDDFASWMKANYSWYSLILAILAVLPTWAMFRYSPRHTRHSLPEGFFIQIFLAVIMLALDVLGIPLGLINPHAYTIVVCCLYGVYYLIVYKYLFGYSFWGTLWRSGFILVTIVYLITSVVFLQFDVDMSVFAQGGAQMTEPQSTFFRYGVSASFLLVALSVFAIGFVINYMVSGNARRQIKQQKTNIPYHS